MDLDRAQKFYETVFNISMTRMNMEGFEMAMFPSEPGNGKLSGAIAKHENYKPSMDGVKIYFNGNPDLADAFSRVEAAGGSIIMPKTTISPEIGSMAFFTDTEGNCVAIHSSN